jgi:hypothetical protein
VSATEYADGDSWWRDPDAEDDATSPVGGPRAPVPTTHPDWEPVPPPIAAGPQPPVPATPDDWEPVPPPITASPQPPVPTTHPDWEPVPQPVTAGPQPPMPATHPDWEPVPPPVTASPQPPVPTTHPDWEPVPPPIAAGPQPPVPTTPDDWEPVPPPIVVPPAPPPPEADPKPAPAPARETVAKPPLSVPCWNCGAQVDPPGRRCAVCGSPRTHVLLLCSDPCLELRHGPGRALNLGRSRSWATPAVITAFALQGQVSRRHASITVEPDGSAWVQEPPEGARNHTYINGARLTPGVPAPLRDRDQLRLGTRISLGIRLYGPEP